MAPIVALPGDDVFNVTDVLTPLFSVTLKTTFDKIEVAAVPVEENLPYLNSKYSVPVSGLNAKTLTPTPIFEDSIRVFVFEYPTTVVLNDMFCGVGIDPSAETTIISFGSAKLVIGELNFSIVKLVPFDVVIVAKF